MQHTVCTTAGGLELIIVLNPTDAPRDSTIHFWHTTAGERADLKAFLESLTDDGSSPIHGSRARGRETGGQRTTFR